MLISALLCLVLRIYWFILLARIILSLATMFWRPPTELSPVTRIIYDLTEPPLALFRRYIPPIGGLDISPIFIFIGIGILQDLFC